ncbi:hypothetical protein EDC01DRAFT_640614 [Geopyxis carbonaria]|nr:hypothetical protein EDC01DRAFT_640614 [Geopyxis carbonaria]
MSSQSSISPTTPITVKVTLGPDTRRFKIPLNDLGPSVFENNLKQLLDIEDKTVIFTRWSDSARDHITLDPNNLSIYKQLFRAAKAKLKLRITARIVEDDTPPLLVESDTASINTTNIPPSYSSVNVDQITSPVPEPVASQILSPKELKETVAKAVTSYCGSEVFTGQLRETVRDEVQKHSSEASIPDLISLQRSTESVDRKENEPPSTESPSSPEFAVYCNSCNNNIKGTYYHCSVCQEGDFDLCKICVGNNVHCHDTKHWLSKRDLISGKVTVSDTDFIRKTSALICNGCAEGINSRYVSCKSCKDYDLCLSCLGDALHGHNPMHEFVRCADSLVLTSAQEKQLPAGRNAYHAAICDSCQTSIKGIRHKCLDCPDFDFCNKCIATANVSHPRHRFVPIAGSPQWTAPYFNSNPLDRVVHYGVYCDGPGCTSVSSGDCIQGPRYKCAICPDTDFCANCEASPLNKHNETHPLIKMRTAIRNVLVTTDDGGEQKLGDPVFDVPGVQSEPEKEKETANVATQVHTIVDMKPTEPKQEIKAEEKSTPEPPAKLEAMFLSDTVPDGAQMTVGNEFTQTWNLVNNGPTSWPVGVTVKFVAGDFMFIKSEEHKINATVTTCEVKPGAYAGFSVNLSATWPANKGYTSYWRLVCPDGSFFGDKLWCSINVTEARRAFSEVSTHNDETSSSKSVADPESVQESFESVHEDLERSNESHESQMIFPKLPVESPVHSTEHLPSSPSTVGHASVPISPVSSHRTLALSDDAESIEGEICSIGDDESFLTDEEYDVLDASDEEFEECERVA